MKKMTYTKTLTVGKLIRDLKKFKKKYDETDVTCCLPDGTGCYITGISSDSSGNLYLSIEEEEDDGGYYDVGMLLLELDGYDKDRKIYMVGCGLYLDFIVHEGGNVFSYEDVNDSVSCDGSVFGEYEEIVTNGDSEYAKRLTEEISKKAKRVSRNETIALVVLMVLVVVGLVYGITISIDRTGLALVESIAWCVVCVILLVIGIFTLYYSKDDK